MNAPVFYFESFLENHGYDRDQVLQNAWDNLPWQQRGDTPRRECWMNDFDAPYTYGSGDHARTYEAAPWDETIHALMVGLNRIHHTRHNCCFINGYADERQHLNWHADDSPEMDHDRPISIISLGAEREIWFKERGGTEVTKQKLGHGSLLIMHPGMQRTHLHRIPKSDRKCGPRVSFTYRGLIAPETPA